MVECVSRFQIPGGDLNAMKRLSLLVVFAGLILTVSSNAGLAGDRCCPKKGFTLPRLLPSKLQGC